MWIRVARNLDKVDKIVKNRLSILGLRESDQYSIRHTPIEKEITKCTAYLQNSQYLCTQNKSLVIDSHGELLNNVL